MRRTPDVLHIRKAGLPGQDPLPVTIPVRRALEMAFHRRLLELQLAKPHNLHVSIMPAKLFLYFDYEHS